MPMERMSMRRVRDCLRLKSAGISAREIARRLGVASSTVRLTLRRCERADIAWPLAPDISDAVLEERLFAASGTKQGHRRHAEPDWAELHREMKRKHVTLSILWDEYIERHPGGYRYSRFCDLYREWERRLPVTMRQTYVAGERLFVDYAGDGVPVVIDRLTGEIRMAQIFVAVLGASSFTFAKASWTQTLPDWIDAHVGAFEAIGGVPQLIVPDNAKTAIVKACFHDPQVNRAYADMAAYYGTALLPARPRKPRDKEKASYCTLFGRWRDGDKPRGMGVFSWLSLDDVMAGGKFPEASVGIVAEAFFDQALPPPFVHCRRGDIEPGGDLLCRQEAPFDEALSATG
jgi:hypothetical protein